MTFSTFGAVCAYAAAVALATPALAAGEGSAVTVSGEVAVDIMRVDSDIASRNVHEHDTASVTVEADLEKLMNWSGGTASFSVLHTSGHSPNDHVGALQGFNNNETGAAATRLFEAWVDQAFGAKASVRLGIQDLNGEFYVTDAAGLLLAPQAGLASELAATGPGGPSTYPQAGLAARLRVNPTEDTYFQVAGYNAHVGSIGDAGGVNTNFDQGWIEIAEAGWTGRGKIAIGAWRYTDKQDDPFYVDLNGDPVQRDSHGYYIIAEHTFIDGGEDGRSISGFIRAGVSDGRTGPFKSSWQTGVLVNNVFESRPGSAFSIGFDAAQLGDSYRQIPNISGGLLEKSEGHFEITYFHPINDHLSVQPDLQLITNPGGVPGAKNAWAATVRVVAGF